MEAVTVKIRSVDHFVITTKDLAACLHFYVDILGMEHRMDGDRKSVV